MDYVLKGSLYKEVLYNLDKSLTVEGLAADAKAVGDAVKALAPVDDLITDDASKTLSARQGKLLNDKIDTEVEELHKALEGSDVIGVKETAEKALETAESAKTIATEAQKQVDNSLEVVVWTVNGVAPDQYHNVTVPTDKSLTLANVPADGKAVGDALKTGGMVPDATLSIMGQAADAYMTGYRLTELEARVIALEENGVSNLPNAEEVSF